MTLAMDRHPHRRRLQINSLIMERKRMIRYATCDFQIQYDLDG